MDNTILQYCFLGEVLPGSDPEEALRNVDHLVLHLRNAWVHVHTRDCLNWTVIGVNRVR